MKKSFLGTVLALFVLTTQGCVPLILVGAAGAGGIVYVQGKLEKNFDKPLEDMRRASLAGLKSLNDEIVKEENTPHHSHITAIGKDDKKIAVDIEAVTEHTCTLKIRVGTFGSQEKSRAVLNAIENKI